jgi:Ca-activated chloride channel family protein
LSFDNPDFLWFFFLFIFLIPVSIIRYRKCRGQAALFAAAVPSGERESLLRGLRLRMILSDFFFLLFFGFLLLALAGPRWGLKVVADYRRGVDMVLAFDISRSMDARDCLRGQESISRLERGLEIACDLAADQGGEVRFGTALGKGRGILAVPLTYDSETVLSFIQTLDSRAVSGSGTNLESLVEIALGAFQESVPSRRGIILFSDGETLSGSLRRAAEKARRAGITLSAVGLGSDKGAFIPVEKGPHSPDGFLRGEDGKEVISSKRANLLTREAEKSGGIYVDGSRNDAARLLSGYINSLSAESRLQGYRREAKQRWQVFVLVAMITLSLVRIMGFGLRKGERRKSGSVLSGLICLVLFTSCAKTQGKLLVMEGNLLNARGYYTEAISSYLNALNYEEAAPYAEYGLASVFFVLEEGEAALDRYREAGRVFNDMQKDHPELRYRIHYNSGIIHFEKREYEQAAEAFREALKIDGSRIEAKRNLELSLLSVARSPQQAASAQDITGIGREGPAGSSAILFEYLKQKELEQWKSREWTGESESSGLDY